MALNTDSTGAFDADAARAEKVQQLRQELDTLEGTDHPAGVIDEDGNAVTDSSGREDEVDVSKMETVEIGGSTFRFHVPDQNAMLAFGMGVSDTKNGQRQMRIMSQFLGFQLLDEDFDLFLDRLADPEDEFGDKEFGELMDAINQRATDRAAREPRNGPANR